MTELQKRCRSLHVWGALPLYFLMCVIFYDSGAFFLFVWSVITALFVVAAFILYLPARCCLEIVLSKNGSTAKRCGALLLVLVPYLACAVWLLHIHIGWSVQHSKSWNAARAERELKSCGKLYIQHTDQILYIQDILSDWSMALTADSVRYYYNAGVHAEFVREDRTDPSVWYPQKTVIIGGGWFLEIHVSPYLG